MNTIEKYNHISELCSQTITRSYSTSFSLAIKLLHKDLRPHIHAIYGFVRIADEIVDTFHEYDKVELLSNLEHETIEAVQNKFSLNPILQSFQLTVNRFNIPYTLISHFLYSMKLDLTKKVYTSEQELNEYIYGSAEVVGLMCLKVMCEGNTEKYEALSPSACKLGAAFQKINFLRDIEDDTAMLHRQYFPGINIQHFTDYEKKMLEDDILADFRAAFPGILALPIKARFGVYLAYRYYMALFHRISKRSSTTILRQRIRVHNLQKLAILLHASLRHRLGIL